MGRSLRGWRELRSFRGWALKIKGWRWWFDMAWSGRSKSSNQGFGSSKPLQTIVLEKYWSSEGEIPLASEDALEIIRQEPRSMTGLLPGTLDSLCHSQDVDVRHTCPVSYLWDFVSAPLCVPDRYLPTYPAAHMVCWTRQHVMNLVLVASHTVMNLGASSGETSSPGPPTVTGTRQSCRNPGTRIVIIYPHRCSARNYKTGYSKSTESHPPLTKGPSPMPCCPN